MARLTALIAQILEDAGYAYSFDRQIYMNRKTKKAFSVEFLQDHSENEIRKSIRSRTNGVEWQFYFNREPSQTVKHELESVLG